MARPAKAVGGVTPGEHPLMSNRTLRAMYVGMARGLAALGGGQRDRARQAAFADVACVAAAVVGLEAVDVVFGCREDGVLGAQRTGGCLPCVAGGVARLYAGVGAALTSAKGTAAMVFFERHEVGGAAWAEALAAAAELPMVLVVLPRWKGRDGEQDLCTEARRVGVPGIAVDAADAVAVYRVAQESLVRARMGGGAALIEGVWFPAEGEDARMDALEGLEGYLRRRGVASERWLSRVGAGDSVPRR